MYTQSKRKSHHRDRAWRGSTMASSQHWGLGCNLAEKKQDDRSTPSTQCRRHVLRCLVVFGVKSIPAIAPHHAVVAAKHPHSHPIAHGKGRHPDQLFQKYATGPLQCYRVCARRVRTTLILQIPANAQPRAQSVVQFGRHARQVPGKDKTGI